MDEQMDIRITHRSLMYSTGYRSLRNLCPKRMGNIHTEENENDAKKNFMSLLAYHRGTIFQRSR